MAKSGATTADQRSRRLHQIVELLREQPLPAEVLLVRLNRGLRGVRHPEVELRTLQNDLEWLLTHLGRAGIERVARSSLTPEPPSELRQYRIFYKLVGAEDLIPLTAEVVFLSELEALALVAARSLMAIPAAPGERSPTAGPLTDALNQLIKRLGLDLKDSRIPDIVAVTQAAPQPYVGDHVLTLLRAIRLGEGVEMSYAPLAKPAHQVVAQPIRLALVEAEPYIWAWDGQAGKLKNYKVARITVVHRRPALSGVPSGLDAEVRSNLLGGFRGVAGSAQRGHVVLRLTPSGVPHLRHRRLGGNQSWTDLPDGGARVSFNSSGIDAVKHWLLQCGAEAVVEGPDSLVQWFRAETARMAATYQQPELT